MRVTLVQTPEGWVFRDAAGRVVRLDVTEPRSFSERGEALEAVRRHGLTFDGRRLATREGGDES